MQQWRNLKKEPSGVTKIELQNVTTTSGNTDTLVSRNMPPYVSSLSDVADFFFFNRSINSKWAFLDNATTAFSGRYSAFTA
jgi:hypothetical protein